MLIAPWLVFWHQPRRARRNCCQRKQKRLETVKHGASQTQRHGYARLPAQRAALDDARKRRGRRWSAARWMDAGSCACVSGLGFHGKWRVHGHTKATGIAVDRPLLPLPRAKQRFFPPSRNDCSARTRASSCVPWPRRAGMHHSPPLLDAHRVGGTAMALQLSGRQAGRAAIVVAAAARVGYVVELYPTRF